MNIICSLALFVTLHGYTFLKVQPTQNWLEWIKESKEVCEVYHMKNWKERGQLLYVSDSKACVDNRKYRSFHNENPITEKRARLKESK